MRKEISFVSFFLIFFLKVSAQTDNYVVSRAGFSSPRDDEFSPVFYGNGVVFCSNRGSGLFSGYSTTDNKAFFKLYQADTSQGTQWQNSRLLQGNVNSNLNNGPATFSRNGDTIYFSRNLITEGNFREITGKGNKLGLFFAVLRDGEWTDVQDMRFNDNSWNVTTPFISPDGKRLYFASDKPGGFGGSDLYFSEWRNGYWNNPVNLGDVVNTGGNEAYPFVNESGDLFFSSDSLPGKGGKDIFFTRFADTSWIEPVNLNAPVNSPDNDFGFISDGMTSRGYFSSDRSGGLDIYSFRTINPQFFYCEPEAENNLCFSFSDDASIDIDPISLQFSWDFGDAGKASGYIVQHCYKGPGNYTLRENITDKKTGKVIFEKLVADFRISERRLPQILIQDPVVAGKEITLSADIKVPGFEAASYFWEIGNEPAGKGESVKHVFMQGSTQVKLLANMKESSTGLSRQVCVEKTVEVASDRNGNKPAQNRKAIPLNLSYGSNRKDILINKVYSAADEIGRKAVFAVQVYESAKALAVNDNLFRNLASGYVVKRIPSVKGYAYIIDEQLSFMAAYPSVRHAQSEGFGDARIITYIPADTAEMELWNFKRTYGTSADVYFINNGTTISKKAMPVLDRLILLLKRNPELKILVAAHTESSGSSATNMQLSARQAQSIVEYLVLNGISRSRLSSAGYGGSRPVAPEYPESERLKNRRVDFIKID